MLHPQARALIDLIETRGLPPTHTLSPADARRFYRERRGFTQPEAPRVAQVRELRHGFITMGRVLDEAHTAVALCAAELRRAFGGCRAGGMRESPPPQQGMRAQGGHPVA